MLTDEEIAVLLEALWQLELLVGTLTDEELKVLDKLEKM